MKKYRNKKGPKKKIKNDNILFLQDRRLEEDLKNKKTVSQKPKENWVLKYIEFLNEKYLANPSRTKRCGLSPYQSTMLKKALHCLIGKIQVSNETLEQVRDEGAPPYHRNIYDLAETEEQVWESMEKEILPGFNFNKARQVFFVEHRDRILFLKPKYKKIPPPDFPEDKPFPPPEYPVPGELYMAEVYFFVILRMFRRQYEKDR